MTPSESAQLYFDTAADLVGLDANMRKLLLTPKRELQVQVPLEMDNGSLETLIGYRVQHDNVRADERGHPVSSRCRLGRSTIARGPDDLEDGRRQFALRGQKGGIGIDPRKLSLKELERLTRMFVDQIHDIIGPRKDIPAPDMGTNHETMSWFRNQWEKYHGFDPACVTGKPVEAYGAEGREEATGRGVGILALKVLGRLGRKPRDMRVAIQGFGNVGMHSAKYLHETECKIVAISDLSGGYYRKDGIDMAAALRYALHHNGSLTGFTEGDLLTNDELLELPVDMLVPAAIGGVITDRNVDRIRAKIIIEAANAPTHPDADRKLHERGIVVLPDILANAGGVTVSYFEWVQNLQHYTWGLNRVRQELEHVLSQAFEQVWQESQTWKVNLRTAAYIIAIRRVHRATLLAGV